MNNSPITLRIALPILLVALAAFFFLWPSAEETTSAAPQAATSTEPAVETLVHPVLYQQEGTRTASFDDLEFEVEADQTFDRELITDDIEALNGARIKIRGYMLPTYRADGIQEFVLVRDNQVCCFGPGAKICHNMQVYMSGDATASYTTRVVEVEGDFSIQAWTGDDGVVYSCYRIDATRVRGL